MIISENKHDKQKNSFEELKMIRKKIKGIKEELLTVRSYQTINATETSKGKSWEYTACVKIVSGTCEIFILIFSSIFTGLIF